MVNNGLYAPKYKYCSCCETLSRGGGAVPFPIHSSSPSGERICEARDAVRDSMLLVPGYVNDV